MPSHSARALAPLIALGFLACATTHPENPALDVFPRGVIGSTDLTYYDVQGRTASELVADMRRLGPKTAAGSYFGETRSPMRWEWRTRSDGMNCTLNSVQIYVRSEIILPRWTPPADTVPGLLAQWTEFLAGLERHEVGHKDISARAAREILTKLQSINTFCSSLAAETTRLTDGILARERQEQERYDAETRHGAAQGATFPPRRRSSGV